MAFKVGDFVSSTYGPGKVQEVRESDGMLVIESTEWKLANYCTPVFYIKAEAPENTPGVVKIEDPKTIIAMNDIVMTPYGTCKCVADARPEDGFYTLEPIRWALANNVHPKYYMQKQYLTMYQKEEDTPNFKFKKYMKICLKCKNEGATLFKSGDYDGAKLQYWEAISNMEKMGHGLSNAQKADVFELTVSVNSNLALCFMKMKKYAESSSYASNSIRLIEALEARAGESSQVFEALVTKGAIQDVEHMNKLWKRKALYCAGKAELLRKNYDEATQYLEMVIKIISGDPSFQKDEEEIKALLTSAKKMKKEMRQKEKNMYKKAMKKASDEDTKNDKDVSKDEKTNSVMGNKINIIDLKAKEDKENDNAEEEGDENEDMWTIGLAIGAVALLGIAFYAWQRAKKK